MIYIFSFKTWVAKTEELFEPTNSRLIKEIYKARPHLKSI